MPRSPFIAYFDESGDHGLENIDPDFPIFALCCAAYRIDDYLCRDAPLFSEIKFKLWWHDAVVFHSYDIRKKQGDFSALSVPANNAILMDEITNYFSVSTVTLIAGAIDKTRHQERYARPENPYHLSLQFCWSAFSVTSKPKAERLI